MFLANENFPRPSILFLRDAGYKIKSIQEDYPGISDLDVIKKANSHDLVILTFDKDYGELIFRHAIKQPPAVVFFRYKGDSPQFAGIRLLKILEEGKISLSNAFTVISEQDIRHRPYS